MHFLPKANPLYEQIAADKVNLPDVLEKLGNGGFTGYLWHTAPEFEACCIYAKGRMICAMSSRENHDKTGFEAISQIFDTVCHAGGEINVYRMTQDLAMCAHALVVGTRLIDGDEVRQVDIKGLLARLKNQSLNGVVNFFAPPRFAMIFYREGIPIGFYHDSTRTIETSPEESRKVAALPGARVEVCSTRSIDELMQYNLLEMVNLSKLWEAARSRHAVSGESLRATPPDTAPVHDAGRLAELFDDLIEVASAYLSKEGRGIVEKRIRQLGGASALINPAAASSFLDGVAADAAAADSHARIDEMIDLMKSEIAGRLAV